MLDLYSPFFSLTKDTYHHITKEIGMTKDGSVPCNTTKDIVFTINGFDLHLTPDQYLDKSDPDSKYCVFYGDNNSKFKATVEKCWIFRERLLSSPGCNLRKILFVVGLWKHDDWIWRFKEMKLFYVCNKL
jgi:hypothetical protein